VGPRAGLDRYGKSRLPPGFDPETIQPVASCYTHYVKGKGKVHNCTGTEALYRPYGP